MWRSAWSEARRRRDLEFWGRWLVGWVVGVSAFREVPLLVAGVWWSGQAGRYQGVLVRQISGLEQGVEDVYKICEDERYQVENAGKTKVRLKVFSGLFMKSVTFAPRVWRSTLAFNGLGGHDLSKIH